MKVLLTGANGFVGSATAHRLAADGLDVRGAARRPDGARDTVIVPDLAGDTDWSNALANVEVVVHTAARVHVMRDDATDPLAAYRRVNVEGTLRLARDAAAAGVKRFVFLSSIKVNGESTLPGRPYTAADAPAPRDPYGVSKLEAEVGLRSIERESGMAVVVIRPVLVYGPGVKGNFLTMMRLLQRGLPLPLGAVRNRRSLVALDNLVDLIAVCVRRGSGVFLVSDAEDLSTPELLTRLARAMGRPARLVPVPAVVLAAAAASVGKGAVARRVIGSLQVDITDTRRQLDWTPPVDVDTALARAAAGFLGTQPR